MKYAKNNGFSNIQTVKEFSMRDSIFLNYNLKDMNMYKSPSYQ